MWGRQGLTQTGFEAMVGLPPNRISKWAGGQGEPTARQALRMARKLGVSVEFLADDNADEPPVPVKMDEAERKVWEIVNLIGPEMAWERLVGNARFSSEPRAVPPPKPKIKKEERA